MADASIPDRVGGLVDGRLDHVHALRTAKAAEGGMRLQVGAARRRGHAHVGDEVGVGGVEQRVRQHRRRQVGEGAGVLVEGGLVGQDLAVRGQADPEVGGAGVALAGHPDVIQPVQHQLDRHASRCAAASAAIAAQWVAWSSLPPKPPPSRFTSTSILCIGLPSTAAVTCWTAAGPRVEENTCIAPLLLGHRAAALRLQVEVLLAADLAAPLDDHVAFAPGAGDVARRHGPRRMDRARAQST